MGRVEYKYLVPLELLSRLRGLMMPYLETDPFALRLPDRQYTVRSLYYDTAQLQYYHEKIEGIRNRKKLRIRCYDDQQPDSVAFLEIKRKSDASVSKDRAPLYFKNLSRLMSDGEVSRHIMDLDGHEAGTDNARKFLFHINKSGLNPVVKVVYDREAFFYKFDRTLRITFDKNLRGSLQTSPDSLFDERNMVYSLPGYFILEIKAHGLFPVWLTYLIGQFHFQLQAISKYTICVDAHPDMKFNSSSLLTRSKSDLHKINHLRKEILI